MRLRDVVSLGTGSVVDQRLRSALTALGIAVGITAVVLLTSLGEGINRYVLAEFTQFGTNLVAITPGKSETFGAPGAAVSNVRPLSLEDAEALGRMESVVAMVPVVQGNAEVEALGRTRRTLVLGVGAKVPAVWRMDVAAGRFLPADDTRAPRSFAVLGAKVRRELFRDDNPLGKRLRVGGDRYVIVGVMEHKGQFLGFDLDDAVYVPAAKALELFRRESLMEIDLLYGPDTALERVTAGVHRVMGARHGTEDYTIIAQQEMLDVLGNVLEVLTIVVGALGGISLVVGGVGILAIMTIAVRERTAEIGLLRAIGAERGQVLGLFLFESLLLSGIGGIVGIGAALGIVALVRALVPELPLHPSLGYAALAEALALLVGLAAGVLPARRAAALEPLEALRAE